MDQQGKQVQLRGPLRTRLPCRRRLQTAILHPGEKKNSLFQPDSGYMETLVRTYKTASQQCGAALQQAAGCCSSAATGSRLLQSAKKMNTKHQKRQKRAQRSMYMEGGSEAPLRPFL